MTSEAPAPAALVPVRMSSEAPEAVALTDGAAASAAAVVPQLASNDHAAEPAFHNGDGATAMRPEPRVTTEARDALPVAVAPVGPAPGREAALPSPAARRRHGEDLIGELFETLHDLHFMVDVVSGAEFVLRVLHETLPTEAALVHIFDMNRRQFVVVRAAGPAASGALMFATPDKDSFFSQLMRRSAALAVDGGGNDQDAVRGGRWQAAGLDAVRAVLCGPVKLGGRYLGVVEVANPPGDEPFTAAETNALDYICKQLAEFLANRPIVIEPDLVLKRS
jgi:hypothetical protein